MCCLLGAVGMAGEIHVLVFHLELREACGEPSFRISAAAISVCKPQEKVDLWSAWNLCGEVFQGSSLINVAQAVCSLHAELILPPCS